MKRLAPLAPLGLVLVAALLVHADALRAPFFADDYLFLDQARSRSLLAALASPDPIGNFFRPVGRQVWFWALSHATNESPLAFHVGSMAVFLAAVAMLWFLARTRLSATGATVAAAFLAVHYAADVPLRWASGSQDLLALAGSIGALLAFAKGRRALAAGLLLLALLAKETVVLAPLIAIPLARRPDERWRDAARRAWPLFAAVAVWVALVVFAGLRRSSPGAVASLTPAGPPAALVLLIRTALGMEWGVGRLPWIPVVFPPAAGTIGLLALGAGVAVAARLARADRPAPRPAGPGARAAAPPSRRDRRAARAAAAPAKRAATRTAPGWSLPMLQAGVVWALVGAAPVAAVAPIWSAYYYLFALAGVGLAIGALVTSVSAIPATALALTLALMSHQARSLEEFATAPSSWSSVSHVNRFYLDRGMKLVARALRDLKEARPTLPHRSTLFFAGIPSFMAWQVADGPLARWAYRDSSLRSYFVTELTIARARRGPYFIFVRDGEGRLRDRTEEKGRLLANAMSAILSDRLAAAEDGLQLELERSPNDRRVNYVWGLVKVQLGQRAAAESLFRLAGIEPRTGGDEALAAARALLASRDTIQAMRKLDTDLRQYGFDPRLHALFSDVLMANARLREDAALEAYAARVLAPDDPQSWRRWATVEIVQNRGLEARAAFEKYFAMRPAAKQEDPQAVRMLFELNRRLPGGDLAQSALRGSADR